MKIINQHQNYSLNSSLNMFFFSSFNLCYFLVSGIALYTINLNKLRQNFKITIFSFQLHMTGILNKLHNIYNPIFMSLKDFSIISKLGEGAYSVVYKVQRHTDKKIYALKKVKLANLSEKEIQNALNEVRILASIKNANLIGYKEAFLQGKNLCIIMEFADDGDLYQKIVQHKKKKQYFEENQIWTVLIQLVIGLKSLHGFNVLHRDLKSANVFLTKNGLAKLGDLNVSKIAKNGLLYTQTGTPYYASPQVWKDQPYDMKSDIWSMGCVIYEMTTLQPPFQAEDMQGLFKAVTLGVYPPIKNTYTKELAQIIKLMLQLKPKSRPTTDKILNSSLIQNKIQELKLEQNSNESTKSELLKTIRIPKSLHYLTDRLPKPNYQHHSESIAHSPSLNQKDRKSSLPKLNKVLKDGLDYLKVNKRPKRNLKGSPLMIQGRPKVIEDARSYSKPSRHLQNQIRAELSKIYRVKGQSEDRKMIKKSDKSLLLPPIKL